MVSFRRVMAAGLVLVSGAAGASCSGEDDKGNKNPVGGGGAGGATTSSGGASGGSETSAGGALQDAGPDGQADADIPIPINCGDGTFQEAEGEECDEGSALNGTADSPCNPACRWVCIQGVREACNNGEQCDGPEKCSADHKCLPSDGALPNGTRCGESHICTDGVCNLAPILCGDGLIVPVASGSDVPEECEDGNTADGDGCDSCRWSCVAADPTRDCRPSDPCQGGSLCDGFEHVCGLRVPLQDLTPCGLPGEDKKCVNEVCTTRYCGNGDVDPGEECEDGNDIDGDGCDSCRFSCVATETTRNCSATNECYENGTCSNQHVCSEPVAKTAGTACGAAGNYCMMGTCVAPVCGDGVKGATEACDDGNTNDKDGCERTCTVECVNATTDCVKAGGQPDAPACRIPACNASQCDSAPGPDGATCNTGSGIAACSSGACTVGTCGNGTREVGEHCDDGPANGPGAGCEVDCRHSCQVPADCADGDPCNGIESCNIGTHRCEPGTPKPDGDTCGAGRICLAGGCHRSVCGDNHWDQAGGEGCDPPNTVGCDPRCDALEVCDLRGMWALRLDVAVTFGGPPPGVEPGAGTITQWAKVDITPTGPSFTASITPCAITVPDFQFYFENVVDHEWYGLLFDSSFAGIPATETTGRLNNLSPGATVNFSPTAIQLGVALPNPFDPTWPNTFIDLRNVPGVTFPDVDGDDKPGLSVSLKSGTRPVTGEEYRNVPVDIGATPYTRADKLHIVVRQASSQTGRLDTCTTMSGAANVTSMDTHVMGCLHETTGADCVDAPNLQIADAARPTYTVGSATFRARKLAGATTCAAVTGALP